ncbi:hypothetical protein [Thalassobaculum sp.]|uniref:hypothetical protein n=1 Tax=Thalassobaculum sp. TaxID=2022740 RepID=UPI0032EE9295
MSILSRSFAIRALAVLAVTAGLAAAAPAPVRAEGPGITLTDGGRHGHDGRRGDRGWDRDRGGHRRHWRDDDRHRGRHWRHGPPPRVHHHYAPPRHSHYRQCRVEWNLWYGGYVRVCV